MPALLCRGCDGYLCEKEKERGKMAEKSKVIFGNPMTAGTYRKAVKSKKKYAKKFGDDSKASYPDRKSVV